MTLQFFNQMVFFTDFQGLLVSKMAPLEYYVNFLVYTVISYFLQNDRWEILRALSVNIHILKSLSKQDLESIAKMTSGFSGADLQALLYNAQLRRVQCTYRL